MLGLWGMSSSSLVRGMLRKTLGRTCAKKKATCVGLGRWFSKIGSLFGVLFGKGAVLYWGPTIRDHILENYP